VNVFSIGYIYNVMEIYKIKKYYDIHM